MRPQIKRVSISSSPVSTAQQRKLCASPDEKPGMICESVPHRRFPASGSGCPLWDQSGGAESLGRPVRCRRAALPDDWPAARDRASFPRSPQTACGLPDRTQTCRLADPGSRGLNKPASAPLTGTALTVQPMLGSQPGINRCPDASQGPVSPGDMAVGDRLSAKRSHGSGWLPPGMALSPTAARGKDGGPPLPATSSAPGSRATIPATPPRRSRRPALRCCIPC